MKHHRELRISLNRTRVGVLSGATDSKNHFVFDDTYIERGPTRPVLTLAFVVPDDAEATTDKLDAGMFSRARLPPYFSNLLPEGAMRDMIAARLGVAVDDELAILSALGKDLPGAVIAKETHSMPVGEVEDEDGIDAERVRPAALGDQGFSLAGVQLKFSMIARGARLTLPTSDEEGDFIVKPPTLVHPSLPLNEFAMMTFARAAGVDVPPIRLVSLDKLKGIEIPETRETHAYAIARFDRTKADRIHAEDFAQVLELRPTEKYGATNYDTMARLILGVFPNAMHQVEQMIRRLVVNVLVANADAHVKNWSVIYRDGRTPELAPAYDIVCTLQYAPSASTALNMARVKNFYDLDESVWRRFARRVGIAEKFVMGVVEETVAMARERWPGLWQELDLIDSLRATLLQHWSKLPNFYRWDRARFE